MRWTLPSSSSSNNKHSSSNKNNTNSVKSAVTGKRDENVHTTHPFTESSKMKTHFLHILLRLRQEKGRSEMTEQSSILQDRSFSPHSFEDKPLIFHSP